MSGETSISWGATSGATITVTAYEYLDQALLCAEVEGKREVGGLRVLPAPVRVKDKAIVASIGRVGLTSDQLNSVRAMQLGLQALIDVRPDVRARKLQRQRAELVRQVGYAEEAEQEAWREMVERTAATGVYRRPPTREQANLQVAQSALAVFDKAYPEVAAAMAAERDDRVNRFLAMD